MPGVRVKGRHGVWALLHFQGDGDEAPVANRFRDEKRRQGRDAQPRDGHVADGFSIVGQDPGPHRHGDRFPLRPFELPKAPGVHQGVIDRIVFRQAGHVARHPAALRVVGAAADQALAFSKRARLQRGILQVPDPNGDVVPAVGERDRAVVVVDRDFEIGVQAAEVGDDRAQVADAERHGRGDAEAAAQRAATTRHHVFHGFVQFAQQRRDAIVEGLAGLGKFQPAGEPLEKLEPQGQFEVANPLADHGFRQFEVLGRTRHACAPDHLYEGFHVVVSPLHGASFG
ncbi:hypothetical protein FQZ97_412100 [compost metagenome]